MKHVMLLLAVLLVSERWALSPDGRWVWVDPQLCQWHRAPTGPEHWECVYPGDDWRLDPRGHWVVVPGRQP